MFHTRWRCSQWLHLSVCFGLPAGMLGSNASRPTMPSGEWAPQTSAVRVTCAATTSAMNRPIQGGMIRNPTASIPMRPNSQPGQRQMLQSQVMSIGKGVLVLCASPFWAFWEERRHSKRALQTCSSFAGDSPPCHKWGFAGTLYRILESQRFPSYIREVTTFVVFYFY